MARILIIDDEESLRITFKSFLSKEGHEVLTAWDYESAMDVLAKMTPDVIFADIVLPGGHTGLDILREVKAKGFQCPVIMITGQPGIDTAAEAVRQGAFDYVPKPVRRDTLMRLADSALRVNSLEEEKRRIEAEKERYRDHLDAIFRSVEDAIITVDSTLRVTAANSPVINICGISPESMIGMDFGSVPCRCFSQCHETLKQALIEKKPIGDLRVECKNHNRPHQVVVVNSSLLQGRDNQYKGMVLVIRDITRLNRLERELEERYRFHDMIGRSPRMQQIYNLLEDLADTDTTVLITGESGTGKELLTNALHFRSNRSSGPLIKVNCSALSENLLDSELFGHIKGAYTGAVNDRKGRFELADRGTLFLDEIGDFHQNIQVKLLRALQEKEIERVGEAKTRKIDVRVITATHQDLKAKIQEGKFREDLYYRLKVLEIKLPPLRERRDDIPLFLNHFKALFNKRFNKNIEEVANEVLNLCMNYPWPGNIRELSHAMEHAFILCHSKTITPEHFPEEIRMSTRDVFKQHTSTKTVDSEAIVDALRQTGWNKAKAARLLSISRQTLYRKIAEFNIQIPPDKV